MQAVQIRKEDNVAVAVRELSPGDTVSLPIGDIFLRQRIPQGHKFALRLIPEGTAVIKYGYAIGEAKGDILPGELVHTHNLRTGLEADRTLSWDRAAGILPPLETPVPTFRGFLRQDGSAGIRNEIWILPTVGCVNAVAERLAALGNERFAGQGLDGIFAFPHPYGCSQLGRDAEWTRKILAGLAKHPNAAGVLVLGLGCENNTLEKMRQAMEPVDPRRARFMLCQETPDELGRGMELLGELADYARGFSRQDIPVSRLVVGLKCGGSDGLSGVTANPVLGAFTDRLTAWGGTAVMTEIPETFGAEQILLDRCAGLDTARKLLEGMEAFKTYYRDHGQPIYENPSPGNKVGGITTLEDKSLGCVQKGGTAPVTGVLPYGGRVEGPGLNVVLAPGNDLVSATALAAAGAQMILFTTGRGTPFGTPVPTVKLSSNSALSRGKPNWIDFDAGGAVEDKTIEGLAGELAEFVFRVAGGLRTRNEENGYRGIAIFKDGVTL